MNCLFLPHLHVRTANTLHASFLVGGPPVMPAYFFMHALCRKMGKNIDVKNVALIHHEMTLLGEPFFGKFSFQQRRGAAYTFTNRNKKDYSSKNEHALSLQPTASAHLHISLMAEIDGSVSTERVKTFLSTGRFSGGQIVSFDEPQMLYPEEALEKTGSGYLVIDRKDLMERQADDNRNPAQLLVDRLGARPETGSDNSWLSAACVGYAAITPYALRSGAREGYEHAFAEPLVGLVQYRSLRQIDGEADTLFWKPEWLRDDVFRLHQD